MTCSQCTTQCKINAALGHTIEERDPQETPSLPAGFRLPIESFLYNAAPPQTSPTPDTIMSQFTAQSPGALGHLGRLLTSCCGSPFPSCKTMQANLPFPLCNTQSLTTEIIPSFPSRLFLPPQVFSKGGGGRGGNQRGKGHPGPDELSGKAATMIYLPSCVFGGSSGVCRTYHTFCRDTVCLKCGRAYAFCGHCCWRSVCHSLRIHT